MKKISLLSLLVLLSSCSVLGYKNSQNTIYIENTATIKYSGKGAGASFALMGAMGPMGAAIGVAIDEGISKDIRKNIEASGFDLVAHLCEQYREKEVYCVSDSDGARQTLVIQSIDLTSKGSDDLMQLKVEAVSISSKLVETPLEYMSGETTITLEQAKSDKNSVRRLFEGINLTKEGTM
ncbi:MAG: hypothetical protein MK185_10280 [Saccharospirillaceae bacterium]|nr:hypothetical protein A3759_13770 [Thalassolituus sp. HI0120]MCH2041007.1 hypothetical protein [Saccharospirillaceae bacterium]